MLWRSLGWFIVGWSRCRPQLPLVVLRFGLRAKVFGLPEAQLRFRSGVEDRRKMQESEIWRVGGNEARCGGELPLARTSVGCGFWWAA